MPLPLPLPPAPLLDPFTSHQPFDCGTKNGVTAFEAVSVALDVSWDGNPETFPPFLIDFYIYAGMHLLNTAFSLV